MKIYMLFALSLNYWKSHKRRLLTLAAVSIIGAAALCMVGLFLRSNKQIALEKERTILGDYDAIIYEINEQSLRYVSENSGVGAYGYYRELGYTGPDKNAGYKVVSFPDERSVSMYHMPCTKGHYPENADEIVMDLELVKKLGLFPVTGQTVSLTMYDTGGEEVFRKDYVLSGIIEAGSPITYRGYYRYPSIAGGYDVPAVIVSDEEAGRFGGKKITVYIQTDNDPVGVINEIRHNDPAEFNRVYYSNGRADTYFYILGIGNHFGDGFAINMENIRDALQTGRVWKDFYSAVAVPLFSALIFVIVILSVVSLIGNVLRDRADFIAVLRSLGMTKYRCATYMFIELLALFAVFVTVGIGAGTGLHLIIVEVIRNAYLPGFPSGLDVNEYIRAVTVSPYANAFAVMILSCVIAVLIPLLRMMRLTPIETFDPNRVRPGKRSSRRHISSKERLRKKLSWESIVADNIRFHDYSVVVIVCIIMAASFLGYNYFRALSDMDNNNYEFMLRTKGLDHWDYSMSRSEETENYTFVTENHHDYGIPYDEYVSFSEEDFISDTFARMVNRSTRLAYDGTVVLPEYLNLRDIYKTGDEIDEALCEAQEAMIQALGYDAGENIYALPTVGVMENDLELLQKYVTDGRIDAQKLSSGEEVLIVIPKEMEKDLAGIFHAGDELPLSDIVLSEAEDGYDFNYFLPDEYAEPVFKKSVPDQQSGQDIEIESFAFGRRKDIKTRVGAVIVLSDPELKSRYAVEYKSFMDGSAYRLSASDGGSLYTLTALCLPRAFISWGLPDNKFTEAYFKIGSDADISAANVKWYETFGDCKGIKYNSSYEIREKMNNDIRNVMLVCVLMIFTLITVGIMTAGIKFYSKVRSQATTIARLRALGMPAFGIEKIIIRQNMVYPVIGALFAILPVAACQMLFDYISKQIESGAWDVMFISGDVPWWITVPYYKDLFGYHPVLVLGILVLIVWLLILLATLPQIGYIKKQNIAQSVDSERY